MSAHTDADQASGPAEPNVKAPHFDESVRRVGTAGKATLGAAVDTGRALRKLVSADLSLARSATGRALAWFAVAIVFGASAWLLAMGVVIAALQVWAGFSWLESISVATVISLLVTGLATWRVSVFFEYAGMHATRRQLARIGFGDESDGDDTDAVLERELADVRSRAAPR